MCNAFSNSTISDSYSNAFPGSVSIKITVLPAFLGIVNVDCLAENMWGLDKKNTVVRNTCRSILGMKTLVFCNIKL